MRLYLWNSVDEEWKYIQLEMSSILEVETNTDSIVIQKDQHGIDNFLRSGAQTYPISVTVELFSGDLFDVVKNADDSDAAKLRTELKALFATPHKKLRIFGNDPETPLLDEAWDGLLIEYDKRALGNFGQLESLPMSYMLKLGVERDGDVTDWEDPDGVTWRTRPSN